MSASMDPGPAFVEVAKALEDMADKLGKIGPDCLVTPSSVADYLTAVFIEALKAKYGGPLPVNVIAAALLLSAKDALLSGVGPPLISMKFEGFK